MNLAPTSVLLVSKRGVVVEESVVDSWAKGTFASPIDSLERHFEKPGGGRTRQQYTQDALRFFEEHKQQAQWGKWNPAWAEAFRLKMGPKGDTPPPADVFFRTAVTMEDVKRLYERLQALPWPALAGHIGDFALYETLLAGCAHRVAHGELLDLSTVPQPDAETLRAVGELRVKATPSADKRAFLEYFELLEEIRSALGGS